MVEQFPIKHLSRDALSLDELINGIIPDFIDIKRRLLLATRTSDPKVPDHYFRLMIERSLAGIKTLDELILIGVRELSKHYLTSKSYKVYVKESQFNSWQSIIPTLSPLLIQSAYWYDKFPLETENKEEMQSYIDNVVKANCQYTALPHPYIDELEAFVNNRSGLSDLHIHLNGSTEVDIAWQDFLSQPEKVYNYLCVGLQHEKVKEQLEQESFGLTANRFLELLRIAQNLRQVMFDILNSKSATTSYNNLQIIINRLSARKSVNAGFKHPFKMLFSQSQQGLGDICAEGLMYVMVWDSLDRQKHPHLGKLFHFYLLIQGKASQLLVQQVYQYGFDQFQKITLNQLREFSEEKFTTRFMQMQGNDLRNVKYLEGRFSPKSTAADNNALINKARQGWSDMVRHRRHQIKKGEPDLRLVAHFIKRPDGNDDIRHRGLRIDLWNRAKVLGYYTSDNYYNKVLVGIDAAASEFDTPPEVFGPTFRYLRRRGFKHFTYHVGEDFFHILSGVRSVYEAVNFTGMEEGDRVGHATALGIKAEYWVQRVGQKIPIRQGEWLDNLVFAYYLIETYNIRVLLHLLPILEEEIASQVKKVYDHSFSVKDLIAAWKFRKWCPLLYRSNDNKSARQLSNYDFTEWSAIHAAPKLDNAKMAYEKYHSAIHRPKYNSVLEINSDGVFTCSHLELMQQELLSILFKKKIIIESLPTSNLRIGLYDQYSEYHLWNWMKHSQDKLQIPEIVIGTDDTGIFCTNIFNEYAHLYCCMKDHGRSSDALAFIDHLESNSDKYKFDEHKWLAWQ